MTSCVATRCGFNQTGNLITGGQLVDGVMGLGRNPLSLSTQLMTARQSSQVFSHCLGGEAEGGGTLVMGSVEEDGMSYTPMDSTRRWAQRSALELGG